MTTAGQPDPGVSEVRFSASLHALTPIPLDPVGGILWVAAREPADAEHASVALVVDLASLGHRNDSASATNAMEHIVGRWGAAAAAHLACRLGDVVWVQLDSLGRFDIVLPTFLGRGARVEWRPLRSLSGRFEACSQHSFLELFPAVGPRLLGQLAKVDQLPAGRPRADH